MVRNHCDTGLETLLALHEQIFVIDEKAGYWVKCVARRVPKTKDKPHGVDYSLTLHDATGTRILGFDNAHAVKRGAAKDHRHRRGRVRSYEYRDAATLLEDFWSEVDKILKERGDMS